VAVLAVVLATVAWECRNQFWPRYQGHSASWWLDKSGEYDAYAPSVEAFRAMGAPAVRYLGRTVATRNIFQRKAVAIRQGAAVCVLQQLGTNVVPALPDLLRLFRRTGWVTDPITRCPSENLQFLTPELIADVKVQLAQDRPWRLEGDIRLLDAIGPSAKSAMPALWAVVEKGESRYSSDAAIALWHIGRDTNALCQCLSKCLSNHQLPNWSFYLLGRIKGLRSAPPSIVPLLEQALRHPQPGIRSAAAAVLQKMAPDELRRIEDDLNRRQDELLQANISLLQSTNAWDCANAARALEFFGPRAVAAAPRLVEILKAEPGWGMDKSTAARALKLLGSNAGVVTPGLIDLLQSNSINGQVCEILANFGPPASAAVPKLQALLATNFVMKPFPDEPGRKYRQEIIRRLPVARALASINPHDTNAIAFLREAVTAKRGPNRLRRMEEDPLQTLSAAVTLWKLGLETNSPLDKVIANVEGDKAERASDLLGEIGPAAKPALPALEKRLKANPFDRHAALAIVQIDPQEANRIGLPGLFILCPDRY
jgi:hypothetical protein